MSLTSKPLRRYVTHIFVAHDCARLRGVARAEQRTGAYPGWHPCDLMPSIGVAIFVLLNVLTCPCLS